MACNFFLAVPASSWEVMLDDYSRGVRVALKSNTFYGDALTAVFAPWQQKRDCAKGGTPCQAEKMLDVSHMFIPSQSWCLSCDEDH